MAATSRQRPLLVSILLAGLFAACCGVGIRGALSGTTASAGNAYAAGTVVLADNDTDTALYSATNVLPDTPISRCIKVTYSGSLGATVGMYRGSLSGSLGPYVTLTIERGTGDSPTCSDFSAGATVYSGTLSAFSASAGAPQSLTTNAGASTWTSGTAVTYRVTVSVTDTTAAEGLSTGSHSFTWSAANT